MSHYIIIVTLACYSIPVKVACYSITEEVACYSERGNFQLGMYFQLLL